MERNNLLVTIADKNYINGAKQFFSGAYFNAAWDGDYMLLTTNDVPEEELEWFRNRGIIVNKKELLFKNGIGGMNPIVAHKAYLFTPEFKRWNVIIYIDIDTIIRKSLERLKMTKKFSAVRNFYFFKIKNEIVNKEDIVKRGISNKKFNDKLEILKKNYNLTRLSFCSGAFAFNTEIIKGDFLIRELTYLFSEYGEMSRWGEQLAFNLVFSDWQKISPIYDFYFQDNKNNAGIKNERIRAVILHFTGRPKPWEKQNDFYKEWLCNFEKADYINTSYRLNAENISKKWEFFYSIYLNSRLFLFDALDFLDQKIGQMGLIIKKRLPKTYYFLKILLKKLGII